MENKINIAELLNDCPKGMELDCTMYDNVTFVRVTSNQQFPIEIAISGIRSKYLTKEGCFHDTTLSPESKCVIFPKGKTTWEGFKRSFVEGDIVSTENGLFVGIVKYTKDNHYCHTFCSINDNGDIIINANYLFSRFATEEEKERFFKAIKNNGYKWNAETKTLEKIEDIEDKGNISDGYHTFNELYEYRLLYNASMFNELAKQGLYDVHKSKKHSDGTIPFGDENWFIVQAELPTGQISNHYEMKDWGLFNIPEKEKANPYDGHTPQDVAKRLRDFLSLNKLPKFKVGNRIKKNKDYISGIITNITDNGFYKVEYQGGDVSYVNLAYQDDWELVPNKFDIATLVPFEDKVLVRNDESQRWLPAFWGYRVVDGFITTFGWCKYCIPYNGNEILFKTNNDCDKFFKVWEE